MDYKKYHKDSEMKNIKQKHGLSTNILTDGLTSSLLVQMAPRGYQC